MELKICEFETAKLLQEIGFDIKCNYKYRKAGTLSDGKGFLSILDMYEAPEQAFAQQWFREVHDIHCYVNYKLFLEKSCNGYYYHNSKYPQVYCGKRYDTYEEALEAGLIKCCEMIKTK